MIILLSIIIAVLGVAVVWCIHLVRQKQIRINTYEEYGQAALEHESQELIQKNQQLSYEREVLETQIKQASEALEKEIARSKSIQCNNDTLKIQAEQQALEAYEQKIKALDLEYQEHHRKLREVLTETAEYVDYQKEQLNKDLEAIKESQRVEIRKLDELKAKQQTYIEARKRAQEIHDKQDFYRLVIFPEDENDIALLRDLQKRMCRKDSIDKLIWENYFKKAFDELSSHIYRGTTKIIGIYKITDLITGLEYIGQSLDCRERTRQHIKNALTYGKASNKLYQAMQEHGLQNFTFEILEEVTKDKLNEREKYWIDFYDTKESGLNGTKGNGI